MKIKSTSAITVDRIEGTGCKVSFTFQFDPAEFGEARTKEVWESFGKLLSALLIYPAERAKFLAAMNKAAKKAGLKVPKVE